MFNSPNFKNKNHQPKVVFQKKKKCYSIGRTHRRACFAFYLGQSVSGREGEWMARRGDQMDTERKKRKKIGEEKETNLKEERMRLEKQRRKTRYALRNAGDHNFVGSVCKSSEILTQT